ncbi:DUF1648 domain-containing protein [Streptomyces sp. NPDC046876]|uniref:DUF1648 domain-containing protein n=1 Tax=Streptomyces sp. NPDC046876 TaxID=3155616 RepID=UPI0033D51D49
MNGGVKRRLVAAGWAVGVAALLVAMPAAASGRLPDRLATHWGGTSGEPDGSMPLWAAALFPAVIWAVLAVGAALFVRHRRAAAGVLVGTGALLLGAQASVVRANLDRADWRDAASATGWVVATLAVAAVSGLAAALAAGREPVPAAGSAYESPGMDIPAGERRVWLSRAANPWIQLIAVVAGVVAMGGALVAVGGLAAPPWALIAPFALVSVSAFALSSVQARVTGEGLEVAFGPLGWPVRRWAARDIEWARAENRTPAQVGGWGYRLSGLGTTVMLRSGECLVVSSGGKVFAVSVDDAGRGAALLTALIPSTR